MTTVKDILQRIEKLKNGLSEKNEELKQRETELAQAKADASETKRLSLEHEKTIKLLQAKLAAESQSRNEAYNLAANVEALTKAQREVFELRKVVRQLRSGSGEAPALSDSLAELLNEDPSDTAESDEQQAEILAALEEQQKQIDELQQEAEDKDGALIEMQHQVEEAERKAAEMQTRLREIEHESLEKDAVIAEQQAQLFSMDA